MIVLNGMVGLSLLLGGLRYREQTYNLRGATAFLAVIVPLVVLGLVLPNFTVSSPGPTFSPLHSVFFIIMSLVLYSVFLGIQMLRHRDYFVSPGPAIVLSDYHGDEIDLGHELGSTRYHTLPLITYLLPVVLLSEQIAVPIAYGINVLHAPQGLGGLLIAILVMSPESLASARAALANQLQRSVNILLGSVLAAISLTIPAILTIAFVAGKTIILGLDMADTPLLLLTLAVSMLTFGIDRTNVLLGPLSRLSDANLREMMCTGRGAAGAFRASEVFARAPPV